MRRGGGFGRSGDLRGCGKRGEVSLGNANRKEPLAREKKSGNTTSNAPYRCSIRFRIRSLSSSHSSINSTNSNQCSNFCLCLSSSIRISKLCRSVESSVPSFPQTVESKERYHDSSQPSHGGDTSLSGRGDSSPGMSQTEARRWL
jgi:hypothetical protein